MSDTPNEITDLLLRWRKGDREALERLTPLVYDELRDLARVFMRGERRGHTLQATAVVHEAFVRLVNMDVDFEDRTHFYALAARAMRRVLVDHAKAVNRVKRGGRPARISLDEALQVTPEPSADLVALDVALDKLAGFDARKSRAVELHYFGGLSYDETAVALEISRATVKRDLKLAKAWLHQELTAGRPHAP